MEDKRMIVITAAVALAIACSGLTVIASQDTGGTHPYTTHLLSNTSTVEVPITDRVSKSIDEYGIRHYADSANGLNITSFNSMESITPSGEAQMKSLINEIQRESAPIVTEDNITVYQNQLTKAYFIFTGNDTTHDCIVISSLDLDEAVHAYKSIHYGEIDFSH